MNPADRFLRSDDGEHRLRAGVPGMGSAALADLSPELSSKEQMEVLQAGAAFAELVSPGQEPPAPCLLISGLFGYYGDQGGKLFENRVKRSCIDAWGYPPAEGGQKQRVLNVLLDSRGGMLDSAFTIVLFLRAYTDDLRVHVPRRAKSASTLIALGASKVFLSPFGELGPLDTQIDDPRFANKSVSALDFYQSVDYVRDFGFDTLEVALKRIGGRVEGQMSQSDVLHAAAGFALGTVSPMMESVDALDFGAWGRSLKIGERYAQLLLRRTGHDDRTAKAIAYRLVYGYTHHPFRIDRQEATEIGLAAEPMSPEAAAQGDRVIELSADKAFVGFISPVEATKEGEAKKAREDAAARKESRAAQLDGWVPSADRNGADLGQRAAVPPPAVAAVDTPTAATPSSYDSAGPPYPNPDTPVGDVRRSGQG